MVDDRGDAHIVTHRHASPRLNEIAGLDADCQAQVVLSGPTPGEEAACGWHNGHRWAMRRPSMILVGEKRRVVRETHISPSQPAWGASLVLAGVALLVLCWR